MDPEEYTPSLITAFAPPAQHAALPERTRVCATCKCNSNNNARPQVSRRTLLRRSLFIAGAHMFSTFGLGTTPAGAVETQKNDSVCKNCRGERKVPCDLCSGTGFWRALTGSDPNQKYKGVVCPECEGIGTLTCPVCLGTGEGSIRGLLRRRKIEPGPGRILQTN